MNSEKIANKIFDIIVKNEKELTKLGLVKYNDFTNFLKIIIGDLGVSLGYETATNCSKEYNEKEWLYDLVWYKMNDGIEPSVLKSVDLVLETEISGKKFSDFKIDFDKLLIATKSTKIMLFSKVNKNLLSEIVNYVQNTLNMFDDLEKGEQIYLIFWDENDTGKFEMSIITK